MRNYIQPGNTLTLTAPAEIASGAVVIVGSIIGVANGDAENGAPVDVDTVGVFRLPQPEPLPLEMPPMHRGPIRVRGRDASHASGSN